MKVFSRFPRLLVVAVILLAICEQHSRVRGQPNIIDDEEPSRPAKPPLPNGGGQRGEPGRASLTDLSTENGERLDGTTSDPCEEFESSNVSSTSPWSCVESTTADAPKRSVKTDYVGFVVIPLFLVLGLFGNTMTVIVMSSHRFRHTTCSLILIFLSCSDTALILMQPWNKPWIIKMLGVDIRALSEIGCKIFFVFRRTAKMSSSWLVVFVCFERFVAVCFPLNTKLICTKRNTTIGIATVYAVMFAYTGAWSIFSKVTTTGKCVPYFVESGTVTLGRAFMIVGTSLYAVIPTVLLLVMTPVIVHRLYQQRNRRKQMVQGVDKKPDDTARITTMLLSITTAYVILVSPIWIGHNVAFARGETLFQSSDPVLVILRQVAQPMEQLNYSINFLLYVLYSRSFRQHVAKLLSCGRCSLRKEGAATNKGSRTTSTLKQTAETNATLTTAAQTSGNSGSNGVLENDGTDSNMQEQQDVETQQSPAENSDVANKV